MLRLCEVLRLPNRNIIVSKHAYISNVKQKTPMKKILFIAIIALVGCSKDDDNPQPAQNGCVTGIPNGGGDRVQFGCSTKAEMKNTAHHDFYHDLEWSVCSNCK